MTGAIDLLLFDLDGTVIDSAPDLAGTANALRADHGLPPLPFEALRPMVGAGARGMLGTALGVAPGHGDYDELRERFLSRYESRMLEQTRVFSEMDDLLGRLERTGLRWGIVTNKAMRFTQPIAQALGLAQRAAVIVGGDSTPHSKPHPEPLLEAARRAGVIPSACAYVGDDRRDILAGRAAGMATAAAAWGYLGDGEPIEHWGADCVAQRPADLLNWLRMA